MCILEKKKKISINACTGCRGTPYLDTGSLGEQQHPWKKEEKKTRLNSNGNLGNYQMKSLQMEQKVGCLKNVAMNLCPFTSCTLRLMAF
jgi:hypothetical protein